ncbi:MAG: ImmA/IrrE family metallo-endopeptidase [Lactobacillus sp.]|nr:ImmA/IrrE family metallo-endopeptidase [Lactobacillus sp.]
MSYEYTPIPYNSYQECFDTAEEIISDVANAYKIDKTRVRYNDVINYLYSHFRPFETACFSTQPYSFNSNYSELNRFNGLLGGSLGLSVCCSNIRYEKPSFVNTVSGLTLFYEGKAVLLLNTSIHNWSRLIFTITHELVHVYKAEGDANYTQAAALIGSYEASQTAYPEALQPLEDKTNVIASLLCVPSISLQDEIMTHSFNELCCKYSVSTAAMHNRLKNYFFYECGWDQYATSNAVFAFRNNNLSQMKNVRHKLANGSNVLAALPF